MTSVHPGGETAPMKEAEMTPEFAKFKQSAYKQQETSAFRPAASVGCVVCSFLLIGVVFIAVGAAVLALSGDALESPVVRYDDVGACGAALRLSPCYTEQFDANGDPKALNGVSLDPLCAERGRPHAAWGDTACRVTLTLAQRMEPPIFMHYQLTNFHQNHRSYISSRLDAQLRGDDYDTQQAYTDAIEAKCGAAADTCTKGSLASDKVDANGTQLYWCNPCGLIARSFFTDEFALLDPDNATVAMSNASIAWKSDIDKKYAPTPAENLHNVRLPEEDDLVTDPDFVVWMRTAAMDKFRKLYRVIETPLEAGEYTVVVNNNYDVTYFGGEKAVLLSQTTILGGPNTRLGYGYVIVGAVCVLVAIVVKITESTRAKLE